MAAQRTVFLKRLCTFALLAAALVLAQPAVADFQASSSANSTLGGLTLGGTTAAAKAEATADNLAFLENKLEELNAQIAGTSNASDLAQLKAVAKALKDIIARLNAGYTITAYSVTSDESTLETIIAVTFADAAGNTLVVKTVIPAPEEDDSSSDEDSSDDSSSSESSGTDLLTQILQQFGSQLAAGQNPLSAVQSTLDNLVANNGASGPVEQMTEALKQAVNAALQCTAGGTPKAANGVAVYDISAQKVYMPDGTVLEAHSGTGQYKDNPSSVNMKGQGSTPPGVYTLSMRESLFHGEEALRMNPGSSNQMYGRDGILVHRPLRQGGGSAGCTVLPEYQKFLAAYKSGQVKQMVVVSSLSEANSMCEKLTISPYDTRNPGSAVAK
jgi:Protein of unknown function (DUF2778)